MFTIKLHFWGEMNLLSYYKQHNAMLLFVMGMIVYNPINKVWPKNSNSLGF